jgi:hypothetical protein
MTKKFISLLISVIMVIGLMPTMGVQAETSPVKILYEEDFNDFTTKAFNSDFSATGLYYVQDDTTKNRLRLGKSLKADIVNMPDIDGFDTDVLKITVDSDGIVADTPSRMYLAGLSVENITDGAIVYEFKMYIPENHITQFHMAPIVKSGLRYAVGTSSNDSTKRTLGGDLTVNNWYKFTYVHFADTETNLCYVNDILDTDLYLENYAKSGSKSTYFNITKNTKDYDYLFFDDFKIWHIAAVSDIDTAPQCITSAASTYAGQQNVSVRVQPKVTFTEMLLNANIEDVATISDGNIIMTTSDGAQTVPKTWEVSSDNKSITITPTGVLNKGTSYRVKLTGLKDMYNVTVPDYEFTFTTMEESKISCAQPTFKKENLFVYGNQGTTISALENGYIRTDLTVSNTDASEKEVFVIALLKENGDIKGFQFDEVTVPASGSVDFNCSFQVDDAANQTIETFVWDSFPGKTPLASKWTFSNSGCTETVIEDQ